MNIKDKKSSILIYFRLFKSVKLYKFSIFISIFGLFILALSDGFFYKYLLPHMINDGFLNKNFQFLFLAPFFVIFIFFIRGIATFLTGYFMAYVGRSVVRDFRKKILYHIMHLPASFYDLNSQGNIISKINYDTEQIAYAISNAISDTLRGVFIFTAMLIVMLSINWILTIIVIFLSPILIIILKLISIYIRYYSKLVQNTMAKITHSTGELFEGYQIVRSFGGISYEMKKIENLTERNKKEEMKIYFIQSISVPIMQLVGALGLAVLIYLTSFERINVSVGEFTGMFGAMIGLLRPIKQIAAVNNVLQKGIAGAASVFDLLEEPIEEYKGSFIMKKVQGNLIFKNVFFNYKSNRNNEQKKYILNNINININHGETVAIIGPSGSGKTTLISLLLKFYNVNKGGIYLDGVNINKFSIVNLRKQISLVSQNIILFDDTIGNNIAYNKKKISEQDIIKAAYSAYTMPFIKKLPYGLNSNIGSKGSFLSTGQKQRISIARAILKNSPILILDEATSSLDLRSEYFIKKSLENLMKEKTIIIIAHKISTIKKADKIIVLENGKIVECGTHKELSNNGNYYSILKKTSLS